jgi:hypothetical protein
VNSIVATRIRSTRAMVTFGPNGGSVLPYVLVMGILFVIAAIAFSLPGPKRNDL